MPFALLQSQHRVEEIEPGIYSALPPDQRDHHYDRIAKAYDQVVGNPVYNRLLWGNWPHDYRRFTRTALDSTPGPYLDAGCGSLVFTATTYLECSRRPLVLMDRSLGMLRKAKQRLLRQAGAIPGHITLLQGDLFDLPFTPHSFASVAAYGVLHLFSDVGGFTLALQDQLQPDGRVWLSSLVRERGIGRHYLDLLVKTGEAAEARTCSALVARLRALGLDPAYEVKGNMAYLNL